MKRIALALALLGGMSVALYYGIVYKPCEDCHCQSGGMCCCGGKCKPKCDCPNCRCRPDPLIACPNCEGEGWVPTMLDSKKRVECPLCLGVGEVRQSSLRPRE